jgi:surface polysaccharide O-acyltransferase-like enzyme
MRKIREVIHMTKREYNVDLFRIIASILVIFLHVLGQGGILAHSSGDFIKNGAAWLLEIAAYCAVNCFALISGYVMCTRSVKVKSIIALWFQVIFYSLTISSLFFIFLPESRTIKNLVIALFPIIGRQWWYVSAYFAMFFFIPFLNEAINRISKETFGKLLIVILIVVCCIDCVIPTDAFILNNGYSPIWLMIVYLFGAYLKKYDIKEKITALKSLIGFFAMVIITFASKIAIHFLTAKILGEAKYDNTFISYTSITILFASIFLFLFCLNIKTGGFGAKLIAFFSPATLGIYLIHVQPLVFEYILKDAFAPFVNKHFAIMIAYIFIAVLAIFISCSIIELLRIGLFKLLKVGKLCEIIENKLNGLYLKVFGNK